MKLSETDKMLIDRGWFCHGHNLWSIEIGERLYAYNTEKGILTTQDGWIDGDIAIPHLHQSEVDFTTVLSLGFSDDWAHPANRLERDKLKLEHLYHLSFHEDP
tara:strand:- start:71 stop:379 length:309 start_codon:yes stop_codon:yes gene_type:complete